jgi:molybdopterin synthase catalytic subunit
VKITVLLFAQARERAGCSSLALELPEGSRVGDAVDLLTRRHPALDALRPHLAVAMNGRLVRPDAAVPPDAELALLPPVSGG